MKAATNTSVVMLAPRATVQAKAAARVTVMPGPRPPHQLTAKSSSAQNANPLASHPPQRASKRGGGAREGSCPASQASWLLLTYYIYSVVSPCGKEWSLDLCGPMGPLEAGPAALRTGLTWFRSVLCDV